MKACLSLLAATALVASRGTAQLLAQGPQTMSVENMSRVQVTGTITGVDQQKGEIMIETADLPGIEGAQMPLSYTPAHPAALTLYGKGDVITADIQVTDNGPRVESIGSFAGPARNAFDDTPREIRRYQIEANIAKIDGKTGELTIESTKIPGHQGAKMTLSYTPSHPSGWKLYHEGDKVLANLVVTDDGPRIGWISSFKEPLAKK